MNVILSGIVGSTAYGLATPGSDVDRLGTYAAPTVAFHGLHPPIGKAASQVRTNPDVTLHEVGKFVTLCLSGNPTVTELLWLPDDLYEIRTPLGDELIGLRHSLLSRPRVRDAYLGYATQQFRRLEARGDGSFDADLRQRTEKHARHLMRLCYQGLHLYRDGVLIVHLPDPEAVRQFGQQIAAGDLAAARLMIAEYEAAFDGTPSSLPEHPDQAAAERWLRRVRAAFYVSDDDDGLTTVGR